MLKFSLISNVNICACTYASIIFMKYKAPIPIIAKSRLRL